MPTRSRDKRVVNSPWDCRECKTANLPKNRRCVRCSALRECLFYKKGGCNRGSGCAFAHVDNNDSKTIKKEPKNELKTNPYTKLTVSVVVWWHGQYFDRVIDHITEPHTRKIDADFYGRIHLSKKHMTTLLSHQQKFGEHYGNVAFFLGNADTAEIYGLLPGRDSPLQKLGNNERLTIRTLNKMVPMAAPKEHSYGSLFAYPGRGRLVKLNCKMVPFLTPLVKHARAQDVYKVPGPLGQRMIRMFYPEADQFADDMTLEDAIQQSNGTFKKILKQRITCEFCLLEQDVDPNNDVCSCGARLKEKQPSEAKSERIQKEEEGKQAAPPIDSDEEDECVICFDRRIDVVLETCRHTHEKQNQQAGHPRKIPGYMCEECAMSTAVTVCAQCQQAFKKMHVIRWSNNLTVLRSTCPVCKYSNPLNTAYCQGEGCNAELAKIVCPDCDISYGINAVWCEMCEKALSDAMVEDNPEPPMFAQGPLQITPAEEGRSVEERLAEERALAAEQAQIEELKRREVALAQELERQKEKERLREQLREEMRLEKEAAKEAERKKAEERAAQKKLQAERKLAREREEEKARLLALEEEKKRQQKIKEDRLAAKKRLEEEAVAARILELKLREEEKERARLAEIQKAERKRQREKEALEREIRKEQEATRMRVEKEKERVRLLKLEQERKQQEADERAMREYREAQMELLVKQEAMDKVLKAEMEQKYLERVSLLESKTRQLNQMQKQSNEMEEKKKKQLAVIEARRAELKEIEAAKRAKLAELEAAKAAAMAAEEEQKKALVETQLDAKSRKKAKKASKAKSKNQELFDKINTAIQGLNFSALDTNELRRYCDVNEISYKGVSEFNEFTFIIVEHLADQVPEWIKPMIPHLEYNAQSDKFSCGCFHEFSKMMKAVNHFGEYEEF